jgi:hypothetical protein
MVKGFILIMIGLALLDIGILVRRIMRDESEKQRRRE